jgi:hypothetical protein
MSGIASNRRSKRASPKPGTVTVKVERTSQARAMLIAALDQADSWSHVLELEYWSREPGVLEIVRALIAMPEHTRAAVEAFCAMVHEPAAVAAELDSAGRLTLTSAQMGRSLAIIQFCSGDDDPDTPRRPN